MKKYASKKPLFNEEIREEIKLALENTAKDASFATGDTYNPNDTVYPDNKMTFVEKHMDYLRRYPQTDPRMYVSNLRLMNRKSTY